MINKEKSMCQELIDAVDEALHSTGRGRTIKADFNVKALLRNKLQLSQREFASNYQINLEALRNCEQDKRVPDLTSITFLTCIANGPATVYKLLNE